MFDIDVSDVEDFEKTLNFIIKNMGKETKFIMKKMGQKSRTIIKSTARKLVKTKTGNYHKRWKLGKPYKNNEGDYRIRVFNNAPHAHLIEDGHRIVRGGVEVGFAEGKKVIQRSNSKLEEKWNEGLRKEVDKMIDKI